MVQNIQPCFGSCLHEQLKRFDIPADRRLINWRRNLGQDSNTSGQEERPRSIGEEKLMEMIERANKALLPPPTKLQYAFHEATKRISIKIINTENNEIIREIPPEKMLDLAASIQDRMGLFVDKRV